MKRALTAALLVAGLASGLGVAHAEVPTDADIAACNREAHAERSSGTASPTAKDETGAAAARRTRDEATKPAGRPSTQSPDPQIHGMDAEGAHDAMYRAAYRVCMRRRGF